MFPFMGMSWCKTAWSHGENAHTKVICMVIFSYNDPACYAFYSFIVEFVCGGFFIINNLHNIPFADLKFCWYFLNHSAVNREEAFYDTV